MINALVSEEANCLLGLSASELEEWAEEQGEQAFRGRQIYNWLYQKGVKNLGDITVLPKPWRMSLLEKGFEVGRLKEVKRLVSSDETMKLLLSTFDGEIIETVGIPTLKRLTVCVSSQIGCSMGCRFCATGKGGLQRSLKVHEIIDQVLSVRDAIGRRPSNVVFMGMGEPLLNIEAVLNSIRCLNNDLGIGQRRITISTVGVANTLPRLTELAKAHLESVQFTLAISLHAPNQKLRESLIPSAKTYPINELLKDCSHYFLSTGRRVSFEYILIGKINDQVYHAEELASLLKGLNSHVNLIAYNPIDEEEFTRPPKANILAFQETLERCGIPVSFRSSRGLDQNAACGQLRNQHAALN